MNTDWFALAMLVKPAGYCRRWAKTTMNNTIASLCIASLLLCGCTAENSTLARFTQSRLDATSAASIATEYLKAQSWKDQYILTKPTCIIEGREYWDIYFQVKATQRPSEGLVRINSKTGEPNWVPLR